MRASDRPAAVDPLSVSNGFHLPKSGIKIGRKFLPFSNSSLPFFGLLLLLTSSPSARFPFRFFSLLPFPICFILFPRVPFPFSLPGKRIGEIFDLNFLLFSLNASWAHQVEIEATVGRPVHVKRRH